MAENSQRYEDSFDALLRHALRQVGKPSRIRLRPELTTGTKLANGRFELVRHVGTGGMGVVYEAFDRDRHARVAIKTLPRLEASDIYSLKNEFRALANVTHPNLVQLHELFADDDIWFFTMDLIDGVAFGEWVRPANVLDESRLRSALPQLLSAVLAIHEAGKLHRDLKPSNVLVTPAGHVVVLDFGLAADPEPGGVGQTIAEDSLSGTPAYMAPEQAAGQQSSAASDLYAIGVMLFEALCGRLPFEGSTGEVLAAKQRDEAPHASRLRASVPADLDALCAKLLERDATQRMAGEPLATQLAAARALHTHAPRLSTPPIAPSTIVGREAELAALRAAYAASRDGDKPVLVLLSGESGIGKSALVECFLTELREQGQAVVLAGRCYERESVPFKGFDALIDELSRYLRKLTANEIATAIPREVFALRRLFPVLGRIDAIAHAPERAVPDAFELRRRGFLALGELLGRIRDRHTLVVAIDDLQWSDHDSTSLLQHLLRQSDAPRLLLIASHRSEGMHANPVLKPLYEMRELDIQLDVRPLACGPLLAAAAASLVPSQFGESAEGLLREAGGNPFLLGELTRAGRSAAGRSLAEILRARVMELSPAERTLLEVVAIAARPVQLELAAEAAGQAERARALFDALRAKQLLRSASSVGSVECYHDRIRESVAGGLTSERVRHYHAALGHALLGMEGADPEHLSEHFEHAGDPQLSAAYAVRAGDRAVSASAFGQAARFYEKALALGEFERRETHRLRVALGDALANGGWGPAASAAYVRACETANASEVLELKRRAAVQLMWTGRLDLGRALFSDVLGTFGMSLPRTPARAAALLVFERTQLRFRGLELREPTPRSESREQLLALHDLVAGIFGSDLLSCAALNAQSMRRALDAGDAYAAGAGIRLDILNRTLGIGDSACVPQLLERSRFLHAREPTPRVEAIQLLLRANYETWGRLGGDCAHALALVTQFLSLAYADPLSIAAYERGRAEFLRTSLMTQLGRTDEVARELPGLLNDTWQRGDRFLPPLFMSFPLYAWLAIGAHAEAEQMHERATREWSSLENPFGYQDVLLHVGRASLRHYRGDVASAWASCLEQGERFSSSFASYSVALLNFMHFVRGTTAAALAAETKDGSARKALLHEAERMPLMLRTSSLWKKWMLAPHAAAACARGQRERAVALLRELIAGKHPPSFGPFFARAVERRLGVLLGGDEGKQLVREADAFFRAGGTRDPERLVRTIMPGCEIR